MSLTTRLSTLFLGALGVVLLGFSAAIYASAWYYLGRQLDERLAAATAVLAAAAEVHPEGVEWEPQERVLPLGLEGGLDRLRWMVFDGQGRRVDQSRNLADDDLTDAWTPRRGTAALPARLLDRHGRPWRVAQRQVHPGLGDGTGSRAAARARPPAESGPWESLPATLVVTACAPTGPVDATLARLAGFLATLSLGVWLPAALLCRRLSRQALAPLTRLVASARGLDASDPGWSLDDPGTGDELDELGRAFNELLGRLHLAYERQRRFGSDASHQLRTPLTVLIGQVEVALRHERSGDEYRRVLRSALGRALQLSQIVEALLFLARAEGDSTLSAGEPLDLRDWVSTHLADSPWAVARRPELDAPIPVVVHAPLLGQALDNLLDNARKYGRPGDPIVVETSRRDGSGVLTVVDSGPGIPSEDLPHVFEPFYRSPAARRLGTPGAGLGLALVQRIAAALGGTVAVVQGEPDRGCRVELRLPLAADADALAGAPR